jgi:hypothetical protein
MRWFPELRSFFRAHPSAGGVGLEHCAVTECGIRCVPEYNCLGWGGQAGIAVYERGTEGLLAAARVYDDVEAVQSATDSA